MIRAIRGNTQMADQFEAGRVLALGKSVMVVVRLRVIPNQSGIESYCGQHGQNHHTGESDSAKIGFDTGKPSEIHDRYEDGDHKDVEHRPATDELDKAVHPDALACRERLATL